MSVLGGVFAPGLIGLEEEGFDVDATGVEEGTEDLSTAASRLAGATGLSMGGAGDGDYGVDGAEALGPGSAEELHENGLGLVVESVGGEDGIGLAGEDEGVEEIVADGAGGFFDGLGISGGTGFGDTGRDAGAVEVEGDVESGAEGFDELQVGGGFFGGADAVVDMSGGEADAEGFAGGGVGGVEGEQEGDGVGATGEGYADTVAGFDVGAVEGEWGGGGASSLC